MKNKKGFTLIELLAVITIMGILMLIAIPAVSRTIENSRKSAYAEMATSYVKAVSTAIAEDNLYCIYGTDTSTELPISTQKTYTNYYVNISTSGYDYRYANSNASNLMESGGKSPWGNAEIRGWIQIYKSGSGSNLSYSYYVILIDSGLHAVQASADKLVIKKNQVTNHVNYTFSDTSADYLYKNSYYCRIVSN